MKLKNPICFVLMIIFIVLNIIDVITAFFILPGEANPIFLLTQSIYIIILLKIIIIGILVYVYKKNKYPTHFTYFNLMLILLLGNMLLSIAIYSNVSGMILLNENPQYVEVLNNMSQEQKMETFAPAYIKSVGLLYILPMICSLISFMLYRRSLKYIIIEQK